MMSHPMIFCEGGEGVGWCCPEGRGGGGLVVP